MTLNPLWLAPPPSLLLRDDEVHVWHVSLDLPVSQRQSLTRILSADELQRAERFYSSKDRWRFIAGRGLLRIILSDYMYTTPEQLQFCYNAYGKPALVSDLGQPLPSFNVSHSDDVALLAISFGREIGIDIERIRKEIEFDQLASHFFSPYERDILRMLPAALKPQAFFRCWTRKEAYIKARGEGLSLPLDQFDVSVVPGEPAKLLNTNGGIQESARWSLQDLMLEPDYVATVAVEGTEWQLKCWQRQ